MIVNSSLHTVKALSHSASLCQALDLIQIDHHIWDIRRIYLLLSVSLHWVLYSLDHEALQLLFLQRTHTCSHTYTHTHFKSNWIYHYKKMVMRIPGQQVGHRTELGCWFHRRAPQGLLLSLLDLHPLIVTEEGLHLILRHFYLQQLSGARIPACCPHIWFWVVTQ